MELSTQEVEELEVTIVPSTVAEIIYLKEQEWDENNALSDDESSCFQHLQPVDLNDETIPREDFANSTTSDKDKSNDVSIIKKTNELNLIQHMYFIYREISWKPPQEAYKIFPNWNTYAPYVKPNALHYRL